MIAFLRLYGLVLIDKFYKVIALTGRERLPTSGPLIVVANHPNGLLDPLVARIAVGRPLAFLAKSGLFGNPIARAAMAAFQAIPVFRPRDGEDANRNEDTFRRCRELLGAGGWLMLFPEGTSHSDPAMKPMKTGAARIALSSGLETLRILPLGLLYEDKGVFRSRVAVQVGETFDVAKYLARYREDERAAVTELTNAIHDALAKVVLEADSDEIWRGLLAVAAWTDEAAAKDVAVREARARALAEAYRRLQREDPDRASELVEKARRFALVLRTIGVDDPWAVERAALRPRRLAWFVLTQILLAPAAIVGVVLGWIPYRLTGVFVNRTVKDTDLTGTVKAVAGSVFLTGTWLAEALAVGVLVGWRSAIATFVLGAAGGWCAIRFQERLAVRREALRGWWVRASHARVAEEVARLRSELASTLRLALEGQ